MQWFDLWIILCFEQMRTALLKALIISNAGAQKCEIWSELVLAPNSTDTHVHVLDANDY